MPKQEVENFIEQNLNEKKEDFKDQLKGMINETEKSIHRGIENEGDLENIINNYLLQTISNLEKSALKKPAHSSSKLDEGAQEKVDNLITQNL